MGDILQSDSHLPLPLRIESFTQFPKWPLLFLLLTFCSISYVLSLIIYRLYWSPLAIFPGPFLAKVTHWYEFYHNFVRTGKYYEKIREMHDKYGMLLPHIP